VEAAIESRIKNSESRSRPKCHVLLSVHVSGTIDTDRWPVNDGKKADSACGIDV
jgi:hypothetical protein